MLHARAVRDHRLPHVFHLMKRFGLDALAARREVIVYDVETVLRQWFRGPMEAPLPALSDDDVARLRAPDSLLVLDGSGEADAFPAAAFRNLSAWCERTRVPLSRLVLFDQDPASKAAQFARWAAAEGAEPALRFGFAHFWMDWVLAAAADQVPSAAVLAAIDAGKAHRFLNLNNAPRPHRVLLAAHILRADPEALVSLSRGKLAAEPQGAPNNRMFAEGPLRQALAPFRASAAFMARHGHLVEGFDVEATVARTTLPGVDRPSVFAFDVPLYGRTLLSVVGETEMARGGLWRVTEKTLKPALFGHPFLVAGNPRALDLMRRLGFQTFPALFDEGYDTVPDPAARLALVLDEIGRLAAEPVSALADRVAAVRREVVHNHDHGMRKLRLSYAAFVTRQVASLLEGGPGVLRPRDIALP